MLAVQLSYVFLSRANRSYPLQILDTFRVFPFQLCCPLYAKKRKKKINANFNVPISLRFPQK